MSEEMSAAEAVAEEKVASEGPAPEAVETPEEKPAVVEAPEPAAEPEGDLPLAADGTEAEPVVEPYKPNTSFKVYNEEHQIEEMYHSLMTDEAKENLVRQLHEKAFGLDKIKPKYQDARKRLEEVDPLVKQWDHLNDQYNKKDYDTFFKGLGVSDEAIYEYAQKRLAYQNLTPDEKSNYDKVTTEREQLHTLQQEVETLRTQQTDYASQTRGSELDAELTRPEVAGIVEKYDAAYGTGAFRNLAIDTGEAAFKTTGVDHGAKDVVGHLSKQYQPFMAAPEQTQPQQQGRQLVVPAKKEAIPNIQGQTTSPVRREPKSLDDLRKIREALAVQDEDSTGTHRVTS